MGNFYKKTIVFLILISLSCNSLYLFNFKKANAITFPPTPPLVGTEATGIYSVPVFDLAQSSKETVNQSKDFIDSLITIAGRIFKSLVLDRLVDALITWIQRGGEGGIVEDWGEFWEDAGQGAVGLVAQELGRGWLCDPFQLQLNLLFQQPPKFSKEITCTLDKITGNINNFLDDFNNGKWIAYNEILAPQNNFYGSTLIAWNEAIENKKRAQITSQNEAVAGKGFLSFRDSKGNIITPGSFAADITEAALIDIPTNSIINASDIAAYIGAIANAAVSTFAKQGLDEMLGRRKKTSPNYPDPCNGMTGNALSACLGIQKANDAPPTAAISQTYLSKINNSLNLKNQTMTSLNQSIDKQNSLIKELKRLADCNNLQTTRDELIIASSTLTELITKKQPLQADIDELIKTRNRINNATQTDWTNNLISELDKVEYLFNEQTATDEYNAAQSELTAISTNLSTTTDRLNNCLITTTPST